jgi:hypothetical protein
MSRIYHTYTERRKPPSPDKPPIQPVGDGFLAIHCFLICRTGAASKTKILHWNSGPYPSVMSVPSRGRRVTLDRLF